MNASSGSGECPRVKTSGFSFFISVPSSSVSRFSSSSEKNLEGEALRRLNEPPQKIAQFQSLAALAPPSKKQNSRRDFARRLLETSLCYLISSLIGSRPLEASA